PHLFIDHFSNATGEISGMGNRASWLTRFLILIAVTTIPLSLIDLYDNWRKWEARPLEYPKGLRIALGFFSFVGLVT
ncbi:hypothetical protein PENTCL1PPCAC_15643, partial [Pristionchus entomophagus]